MRRPRPSETLRRPPRQAILIRIARTFEEFSPSCLEFRRIDRDESKPISGPDREMAMREVDDPQGGPPEQVPAPRRLSWIDGCLPPRDRHRTGRDPRPRSFPPGQAA